MIKVLEISFSELVFYWFIITIAIIFISAIDLEEVTENDNKKPEGLRGESTYKCETRTCIKEMCPRRNRKNE